MSRPEVSLEPSGSMLAEGEPLEDANALEQFVYDNPDLERLEAILDDFNPFEAMHWTRQEVRHSTFLRWLLDPSETHGLGAYFLRAFAKRIAHRSSGVHPTAPSVFDVDSWTLQRTEVLQEWNSIDLLIKDDIDGFALIVENKIDTGEHSNQLQRYRQLVESSFPAHQKLYSYLTIGGAAPSDEFYVPVDYSEIVALIDDTIERRGEQLGAEVRSFLSHYSEMVRRNIVEDSEVQLLCRRIYEKHKRALDVLFEQRPDKASEVRSMLEDLIREHSDLEKDHCTKSYLRFIPSSLDFLPKVGDGWTPSKRMLLFEVENYRSKLTMRITLGPGPQEIREAVHDVVVQNEGLFNRATQKMYPQYWAMHGEVWLGVKRYEEMSITDLRGVVARHIDTLMVERVPQILDVLEPLREWIET
jgi:hypothetical protein